LDAERALSMVGGDAIDPKARRFTQIDCRRVGVRRGRIDTHL